MKISERTIKRVATIITGDPPRWSFAEDCIRGFNDTPTLKKIILTAVDPRDFEAFVKNAGLGFAIPYLHNGQMYDYVPDFVARLKTEPKSHLILETKGYDPLEEVKRSAAERWVSAVNADGTYGHGDYRVAKKPTEVSGIVDAICHVPA